MTFDATRPDLLIGVVGTGAMGRGIVQVAAAGGINVLMTDSRPGAAQEAREFIEKMLARAAESGMSREDVAAAMGRIKVVAGAADFKPCHVVIEAIVEDLEAKRKMFAELEGIVSPECILVTNTSSMSVTTIAPSSRLLTGCGLSFQPRAADEAGRGNLGALDGRLGVRR
jgi:3-hydroxybutyryl-CoA dehydrogenase